MLHGNCGLGSASLSLVGYKSWSMNLECWVVAVELHVDATNYVQHPALKSVYLWKKPISNMWVAAELHVNTTYYAQHLH